MNYAYGMANPSERRNQPDRRKAPRGGRRPHDQLGSTPLVVILGSGAAPQHESEAVLTQLKFAVAPASNFSEALRAVEGLHPDVIVAPAGEASRLRATGSVTVPIVEYDSRESSGNLVEQLRDAIRKRRQ